MGLCFGCLFSKEQYVKRIKQNDAYLDIAYLLHCRGHLRQARKYINKVKDVNMRNSFWRTISHCNMTQKDPPLPRQNTTLTLASFLIRRINHNAGIWLKEE